MDGIEDNRVEHRFELTKDGQVAELVYREDGDRLVLAHTGVPEALGGHGLGGRLVQAAVERAGRDGLTLVPHCSYARKWLEDHPDALGDVPVDWEG